MAISNLVRISILTKLKLSFVLTLNRFFILLQRGLYSNKKFCSYLYPVKAEARFRVKIKHPHGGKKQALVCFDSKPILSFIATKSIQQQEI